MREVICKEKKIQNSMKEKFVTSINCVVRNKVIHVHCSCTLLVKFAFHENRLRFVLQAEIFWNSLRNKTNRVLRKITTSKRDSIQCCVTMRGSDNFSRGL